tara:strand:- start:1367 stop:1603 length:237 start_codon:yes stop_codon:yes gene_type:complete
MFTSFITGVVVAIPTALVTMKLLNSSLFISNQELKETNAKISLIINNLDDFREERLKDKMERLNITDKLDPRLSTHLK